MRGTQKSGKSKRLQRKTWTRQLVEVGAQIWEETPAQVAHRLWWLLDVATGRYWARQIEYWRDCYQVIWQKSESRFTCDIRLLEFLEGEPNTLPEGVEFGLYEKRYDITVSGGNSVASLLPCFAFASNKCLERWEPLRSVSKLRWKKNMVYLEIL